MIYARVIVVLACITYSCATGPTLRGTDTGPAADDLTEKISRVEKVIEHCEHRGLYVTCELEPWLDALAASGELYRAGGLLRADLVDAVENARMDREKCLSDIQQGQDELKQAKWMKWTWLAVGFVVGSLGATGLFLWFAK